MPGLAESFIQGFSDAQDRKHKYALDQANLHAQQARLQQEQWFQEQEIQQGRERLDLTATHYADAEENSRLNRLLKENQDKFTDTLKQKTADFEQKLKTTQLADKEQARKDTLAELAKHDKDKETTDAAKAKEKAKDQLFKFIDKERGQLKTGAAIKQAGWAAGLWQAAGIEHPDQVLMDKGLDPRQQMTMSKQQLQLVAAKANAKYLQSRAIKEAAQASIAKPYAQAQLSKLQEQLNVLGLQETHMKQITENAQQVYDMRQKFGDLSGRPSPTVAKNALTLWHEMSSFANQYDRTANTYETQAKKHQLSINSMLRAIDTAQSGQVTWGNQTIDMAHFRIQYNAALDLQKDLENKALAARAAQQQYTRYASDAAHVLKNSGVITGPKGEYIGDKKPDSGGKKLPPLPGLDRPARRAGRIDGHTYTLTPK